jgi:protein-disulfide isomerase
MKILTRFLLILVLTLIPTIALANSAHQSIEEKILQVIRNHPKAIIEAVQTYQQQQLEQQQQAQKAALQPLKSKPKAVIGTSPTSGSSDQKVVLLEFSDFQCPYCANAHTTLKQLVAKYPKKLTLVYKHYPLTSIHDQAMPAAQAAWAAAQQGQFWPYHDALFTQQKSLGEALYLAIAKNLNLDMAKFERDRKAALPAIQKDIDFGSRLGIAGTPFLVLNGDIISSIDLADLEAAVEKFN